MKNGGNKNDNWRINEKIRADSENKMRNIYIGDKKFGKKMSKTFVWVFI